MRWRKTKSKPLKLLQIFSCSELPTAHCPQSVCNGDRQCAKKSPAWLVVIVYKHDSSHFNQSHLDAIFLGEISQFVFRHLLMNLVLHFSVFRAAIFKSLSNFSQVSGFFLRAIHLPYAKPLYSFGLEQLLQQEGTLLSDIVPNSI